MLHRLRVTKRISQPPRCFVSTALHPLVFSAIRIRRLLAILLLGKKEYPTNKNMIPSSINKLGLQAR
ncbi:hypothetical protein HanPSC8_Chr16g0723541 [Helianthus annuus]|nr:hypothetical protein HanPSC8_Chr16g0723541 [Helianthus annuus]